MSDEIISDEIISDEIVEGIEPNLEFNNVASISVDEILNSVKLNDDQPKEDIPKIINEKTPQIQQTKKKMSVTKEENIQNEAKELYEEFGSFLEAKADITPDQGIKSIIPTGIDILDAILGGGFAVGTMSIIVGNPGSGKSMLAAQTLGSGQRKYKGKLLSAYLDSEQAVTTMRLANLGVRYPNLKPYSDIKVEKVFKLLEGMCLFKSEKKIKNDPSIVIWDSIANTLSQRELEAEDVNQVIGYKARLLSILVPKYVAKCLEHNIAFLCVNQLRDSLQMGPYQAPRDLKFMSHTKDMPGGQILKFNAFHLLEMKVKSAFDQEKGKYGFDGFTSSVKCVKNKLFTPNIEIEIVGSYLSGFSNFWTNYDFLVKTKRLNSGAWNFLISQPNVKFRTKEALDKYNQDIEFQTEFDRLVKEAIQKDIIEKYTISDSNTYSDKEQI